jgi:hypothetical protein
MQGPIAEWPDRRIREELAISGEAIMNRRNMVCETSFFCIDSEVSHTAVRLPSRLFAQLH